MPIKNKNGHIRVCVDVRNLNNSCLEDDFPLPITKIMVDTTIGHERLTFIDGSSNNNHIWMALADEEKTTFQTPKRIYYYKVMPFGLKNTCATYKRATQKIFDVSLTHWMLRWRSCGKVKGKRKSFARSLFGIWIVTLIPIKDEPVKMRIWCLFGQT